MIQKFAYKQYFRVLSVLFVVALMVFIIPTITWYIMNGSTQAFKRYIEGIIPIIFMLLPCTVENLGIIRYIYIYICIVINLLVSIAETVHLYLYSCTISMAAIESVFATNLSETQSFFESYCDINVALLILVNIFVFLLILKILLKIVPIKCNIFLLGVIMLSIGSLLAYGPRYLMNRKDVNAFEFLPAYRNYRQVRDYFVNVEKIKALSNINISKNISYTVNSEEDFTLICVIGESANRKHQGVYGYKRNTTPFISNEKNKLVFSKAYSPASYTSLSHKKMLTLDTKNQVPLIGLLKEIGCETWWISGQSLYNNSTPLLFLADHVMSLNDKHGEDKYYDQELVPYVIEAVKNPKEKKAIFVNLRGSHFRYSALYPADRKVFNDSKGIDSVYATKKQVIDIINDYDNTIIYTDSVLSNIARQLPKDKPVVMIYLSDHGQDAYDVDNRAAHSATRNIGYEIPFWIWYNDKFLEWRMSNIEKWKTYGNRRFCSDALGFIVCDLLDISVRDGNVYRSPLNDAYKEYPINLPEK